MSTATSSLENHQEEDQELWKVLREGKEDIEQVPLQTLRKACAERQGDLPSEFRPQLWKRFLNVSKKSQLEDVITHDRQSKIEDHDSVRSDEDRADEETEKGEKDDSGHGSGKGKGRNTVGDEIASRLREDIEQLMQRHETMKFDASVAEEIVVRFCHSKKMEYQHEILLLLMPFMPLLETDTKDAKDDTSRSTSFLTKLEVDHCLSSLVQQFVPLWSTDRHGSDKTLILDCFHMLCRLILQYHDPFLSMHFDKHRVTPEVYVKPWINTLFTTQCTSIPIVTSLWDQLILEGDPILPLFFGIAMLIARRDSILKTTSETELLETLNSISIAERIDLMNILQAARDLNHETPLAARNQAYTLLFPSSESNFSTLHERLSSSVVLSVPTSEVIETFRKESLKRSAIRPTKSIHYIVIDCRSQKSFNFARLPTAVHVGPQVGYDNEKMQSILDRFSSARGSHFTIFGTGKKITEEINLLKLIAMKFVSNGFQHISVAPSGFKNCIKHIVANEIEYVRDEQAVEEEKRRRRQREEDAKRLVSKETQEQLNKVATAVGSKVLNFLSWGKQIATEQGSKVKEQIARARAGSSSGVTPSAALASSSSYHHPEPPKSAFSLDDDDDDDDDDGHNSDEDLLMDAFTSEDSLASSGNDRAIKIDDLKILDEDVKVFACHLKNGSEQEQHEQRYIAVGTYTILCLRAHPTILGHGIICWKRSLRHLLRLAYHKTDKSSLTFVLRGRPEDITKVPELSISSTFQESFRMSDSMACIKHIQQCMEQLKLASEQKTTQLEEKGQEDRQPEAKEDVVVIGSSSTTSTSSPVDSS